MQAHNNQASAQASCSGIMLGQMLEQCHVRNARTYVRTTHLSSYLTLGNARRGVARFWPIGDEISLTAGAARGLEAIA